MKEYFGKFKRTERKWKRQIQTIIEQRRNEANYKSIYGNEVQINSKFSAKSNTFFFISHFAFHLRDVFQVHLIAIRKNKVSSLFSFQIN